MSRVTSLRYLFFPKFFSSNLSRQLQKRPSIPHDKLNFYKTLGVHKSANLRQIKEAYYILAKTFHPDINANNSEGLKKFQEITEAYEVLSDEAKRLEYDKFGTVNGLSTVRSRILMNVMKKSDNVIRNILKNSAIRPGYSEMEDHEKLFEEEMSVTLTFQESLTGGKRDFLIPIKQKCDKCQQKGIFATGNPDVCRVCEGKGTQTIQTHDSSMEIPCKFCGGTKLQFRVPCPECDGRGFTIRRQKVLFEVPKLVKTGDIMEVQHPLRRKPIKIKFKVDNSEGFALDGSDVISRVEVPLTKALLGGRVTVKTLRGFTQIDVPPGLQNGTNFRLPGLGVETREKTGDAVLVLQVKIPTNLSHRQREIIQEFEDISK